MRKVELEAAVGETIRIGDQWLTVIDIQDGEAVLRIEDLPPAIREETVYQHQQVSLPAR